MPAKPASALCESSRRRRQMRMRPPTCSAMPVVLPLVAVRVRRPDATTGRQHRSYFGNGRVGGSSGERQPDRGECGGGPDLVVAVVCQPVRDERGCRGVGRAVGAESFGQRGPYAPVRVAARVSSAAVRSWSVGTERICPAVRSCSSLVKRKKYRAKNAAWSAVSRSVGSRSLREVSASRICPMWPNAGVWMVEPKWLPLLPSGPERDLQTFAASSVPIAHRTRRWLLDRHGL